MEPYAILTNRKRAIIALVHSVIFLLLALRSVARPAMVTAIRSLHGSAFKGSVAILAIYIIVTTVLLQLARISRPAKERLYFGLCATSAGFGLLRYLVGDATLPVAIYVRAVALTLAVVIGVIIWRGHVANSEA